MSNNSGVNKDAEIPTERENPNITILRTDNVAVLANQITLQKTMNGKTYTRLIKKNAAGEVIQLTTWA
jgi:hypothetical protein